MDRNAHLEALTQIATRTGEPLEENCYTLQRQSEGHPSLVAKQNDLAACVKGVVEARGRCRVLDVGFGAGHSSVVFLTANGAVHVDAIDKNEHNYTRGCAEYVRGIFGAGRFAIHMFDSAQMWKNLHARFSSENTRFDVIHVDGEASARGILRDTAQAMTMLRPGGILIVGRTHSRAKDLGRRLGTSPYFSEIAVTRPANPGAASTPQQRRAAANAVGGGDSSPSHYRMFTYNAPRIVVVGSRRQRAYAKAHGYTFAYKGGFTRALVTEKDLERVRRGLDRNRIDDADVVVWAPKRRRLHRTAPPLEPFLLLLSPPTSRVVVQNGEDTPLLAIMQTAAATDESELGQRTVESDSVQTWAKANRASANANVWDSLVAAMERK